MPPALYDWIIPVAAAPFVGSFLALVAVRLPAAEGVVRGRSHCRVCGHRLGVAELIPVASWVALKGRCGTCGAPIEPIYPVVELAAVGVAAWAALTVDGALLWVSILLGWTLLTLAAMDLRSMILADGLTLPLIAGGLATIAVIDPSLLPLHALAAVAGFALMAGIAFAYKRLRGRDGLGGGDAKLMAGAGAWTGLSGLGSVLLTGAVGALALALVSSALGRKRLRAASEIPFGAALAAGLWLTWLYGPLSFGGR